MSSAQTASEQVKRPLKSVSIDRLGCCCITGCGLTRPRFCTSVSSPKCLTVRMRSVPSWTRRTHIELLSEDFGLIHGVSVNSALNAVYLSSTLRQRVAELSTYVFRSDNSVDHHAQTPGMVTRGGTESWMHSGCVGNGPPYAVVFVDVSRGGVGSVAPTSGASLNKRPGKLEAPGFAPIQWQFQNSRERALFWSNR
jgi:hypothetical protein